METLNGQMETLKGKLETLKNKDFEGKNRNLLSHFQLLAPEKPSRKFQS